MARKNAPPVEWTPAEDTELVNILEEQTHLGNRSDNGWKPSVWTLVAQTLGDSFPDVLVKKGVKQCKARWQRVCSNSFWILISDHILTLSRHSSQLKKFYAVVKNLRNQSGFGWNDLTQTVHASDDVWDNYLAVRVLCPLAPVLF